ncbi:hypothetical protein HanPSC8_Chr01g0005661 [Helianthus annuus]|nr:hypothetical protein HanPSC8_Chr01g0005661 [Helianthus annuus]
MWAQYWSTPHHQRNLRVISHRFRAFILLTLILVTTSQFASLLVTTVDDAVVNVSTTGELALCSVTLVFGLYICQRSAAKITHKAQSLTSLATKWHMCATTHNFVDMGNNDETQGMILLHEWPIWIQK